MAWPTHNDNDNFQISEAGYPWSTIDPNGWGTHFVKQPHAFYISPSPEPPFTTNLLTETPYTHELQLPSTPNSIGSIPSPGLPYSNMTGDNKSTKEVDLEHFILQRNDAATFPARSCEPGYRSLCDGPVANPQKGSTMISPHGSSHSCVAKSKSRRYSRLSSSKDKNDVKYGTFKCEWEGCLYDRMFSRKGVLMRHIEMQHVNPRSFKCPWCSHATSRRENLKAHRQAVHKERL